MNEKLILEKRERVVFSFVTWENDLTNMASLLVDETAKMSDGRQPTLK